jgi:hypothetical protein
MEKQGIWQVRFQHLKWPFKINDKQDWDAVAGQAIDLLDRVGEITKIEDNPGISFTLVQ